MSIRRLRWVVAVLGLASALHAQQVTYVQQSTADGVLEGVVSADGKVRTFKGIPYAAPPLGPLRWKAPQPVVPWSGVRKAAEYGPRPMQGVVFPDMVFNDSGPSEDCLYLNLWMPAGPQVKKLPVMVWIYGGGFSAGSTSEPRQDGGNLSKKGVLVVSLNYRLGAFGFLAHPELSRESGHNGSGNFGLLDQVAALEWVRRNIATFGGDPDQVTIFGESAGSFSVSALLASPLARGLFQRAIGESGAFLGNTLQAYPLADAERAGSKFAVTITGRDSLAALRSAPAQALLDASLKDWGGHFWPVLDGYFFPAAVREIYRRGDQAHIPLLAGWNRDEWHFEPFFGKDAPNLANYVSIAKTRFGPQADAFLKAYAASTDAEAKQAAWDFESDQIIGFGTWKWLEMHRLTGGCPVYRYEFDQTLPLAAGTDPTIPATAPHASEIPFVFRVLSSKKLPWRPEDHQVSELMASYWTNFAKTGDPNGPGLPLWPRYRSEDGNPVLRIMAHPVAVKDWHRDRYEFMDRLAGNP